MAESSPEKLESFVDEALFPMTRERLLGQNYVQAIDFGATRHTQSVPRSPIDLLFYHVVFQFQPSHRRFYKGTGLRLHELPGVTPEAIMQWDGLMVRALDLALKRDRSRHLHSRKYRRSWAALIADLLAEMSIAATK